VRWASLSETSTCPLL